MELVQTPPAQSPVQSASSGVADKFNDTRSNTEIVYESWIILATATISALATSAAILNYILSGEAQGLLIATYGGMGILLVAFLTLLFKVVPDYLNTIKLICSLATIPLLLLTTTIVAGWPSSLVQYFGIRNVLTSPSKPLKYFTILVASQDGSNLEVTQYNFLNRDVKGFTASEASMRDFITRIQSGSNSFRKAAIKNEDNKLMRAIKGSIIVPFRLPTDESDTSIIESFESGDAVLVLPPELLFGIFHGDMDQAVREISKAAVRQDGR